MTRWLLTLVAWAALSWGLLALLALACSSVRSITEVPDSGGHPVDHPVTACDGPAQRCGWWQANGMAVEDVEVITFLGDGGWSSCRPRCLPLQLALPWVYLTCDGCSEATICGSVPEGTDGGVYVRTSDGREVLCGMDGGSP